ncbi:hypothetical protein [Chitinimonas naiadis]
MPIKVVRRRIPLDGDKGSPRFFPTISGCSVGHIRGQISHDATEREREIHLSCIDHLPQYVDRAFLSKIDLDKLLTQALEYLPPYAPCTSQRITRGGTGNKNNLAHSFPFPERLEVRLSDYTSTLTMTQRKR